MANVKKGETKNQHYVPQFYQRNFSQDGKTIATYVLSKNKFIPRAPIKNQSSGDYFYSDNMTIEKTLGDIEGMANGVIKKIINTPMEKLTGEEEEILYIFTMLQVGRTNFQVELIRESATIFSRKILKKLVDAKRKIGKEKEVKDITDEIVDCIEVDFNSIGAMALGTQAQLEKICRDLRYKILINHTDKTFITSDNPAVTYDIFMERMTQNYALGSRGLMIYLPLSPKHGVLFYDAECYKIGDKKKKFVLLTLEKDIVELNKLIIAKATNVIYCNPTLYSEYQIGKLCRDNIIYRLKERVGSYIDMTLKDGSEIIGSYHIPVFCKLSLSFLKELPKYSYLKPHQYNPNIHKFRDIAFYRNALLH